MSRLPHFLDSRLTDGGEVVSPTHQPPFTPRKIPGTHFCWRLSRPQGHSAAGRIRSIEKSNDLIGNQTRDLLACSIVPQPTTLLCAPIQSIISSMPRICGMFIGDGCFFVMCVAVIIYHGFPSVYSGKFWDSTLEYIGRGCYVPSLSQVIMLTVTSHLMLCIQRNRERILS
jgi:hypothetical protein